MDDSTSPQPPPPPRVGSLKIPGRPPGKGAGPQLVLPRRMGRTRSPFAVSDASAEARRQIENIVSVTRAPWGEQLAAIPSDQAVELEKSLRLLEGKLAQRERDLEELEVRLAEREREIAETEALMLARQRLFDAARRQPVRAEEAAAAPVSSEERSALQLLKEELERQEASLREHRAALKEREVFLEESENRLFEKVQLQQETETELEQREDDLRQREARLRQREAAQDPAAARALEAEQKAKRPFDEFNE